MNIEIVMLGTSPLLCHNPRMVDPQCEWTRKIKAITSKRKKTDEDMRQVEDLEWFGGIYTDTIGGKEVVVQPSSKVRKCLINTGRISRRGKEVERAIAMSTLNVPLYYDKSRPLAELAADPNFRSRLSVGLGKKRVIRVRPQFLRWALVVPALFIEDAGLNPDDLRGLVDLAGQAERIGDNRVNGYGGFRGHVRDTDMKGYKPLDANLDAVENLFKILDKKSA